MATSDSEVEDLGRHDGNITSQSHSKKLTKNTSRNVNREVESETLERTERSRDTVYCTYHKLGCPAELNQQEQRSHEQSCVTEHLDLLRKYVEDLHIMTTDMIDRPHKAQRRPANCCKYCGKWAAVIMALVVALVAVAVPAYIHHMSNNEAVETELSRLRMELDSRPTQRELENLLTIMESKFSEYTQPLKVSQNETRGQIDETKGELSRLRMELDSRPTQRELENLLTKMESKFSEDTQPLKVSQNETRGQIDEMKGELSRLRMEVDSRPTQRELGNLLTKMESKFSEDTQSLKVSQNETRGQIDEMKGELSRLRMELDSRPTQRELENLLTKMESKFSEDTQPLKVSQNETRGQIDEMKGELSRLRMEVDSRPTQRELGNLLTKMESKFSEDTQSLKVSQNETRGQIDEMKAMIKRLKSDVDSRPNENQLVARMESILSKEVQPLKESQNETRQQQIDEMKTTLKRLKRDVDSRPNPNQLNNTMSTLLSRMDFTNQALSQVTQSLSDCSCLATWTQIKTTHLGCSTLQSTGTTTFNLPSSIPNGAKEFLAYVQVRVGTSGPRDKRSNLKIYTEEGNKKYGQYIRVHAYDQDASDNMWFPLTSNRKIYLEVPNVHSRQVKLHISAIGYR